MATSFYAGTDIDGRDAIASVDVYTKSDQEGGSVNQQVTGIIKGIIINNENLNHSCCPKCTCCSDYRDVLLLPVCSIKLYDKTKIDKIVAKVYGFNSPLDVSKPDKIIQKYNHQLIPCNLKDDKSKKSVKQKDDKSKKSVKSVSAQILTRDELFTRVRDSPKKLFAVGECEGRHTFVQLRVVDENNTGQIKIEKSQSDEILSTYGPLVLGIRKKRKNGTDEYDVDAIGSYSQEDSGIIITLFGDEKKPLDDEKPSSTQKEVVPIGAGATLSDRGNLQLDYEEPPSIQDTDEPKQEAQKGKKCSQNQTESPPSVITGRSFYTSHSAAELSYVQSPEHGLSALTLEKLSRGVQLLSQEFKKDELAIEKSAKETPNTEIRKMIARNRLRQQIVADMEESLILADTHFIQLYNQMKDKEKIEKFQEDEISRLQAELERTRTKLNDIQKAKMTYPEKAKNEVQGRHDEMADFLKNEMEKIIRLMEKWITSPDEPTLIDLQNKMKGFIDFAYQRHENFRKWVSHVYDADSVPDTF